ncbi:MAG: hypothetical protein QM636_21735 [Rhizobium sp.]
MTLVHNERTKLLANALDRASTACIAAGLIAPVVSAVNGATSLQFSWIAILSSISWLLLLLHYIWQQGTFWGG